jgi:DNA-binding PadR family transcriptional regulator
VADQLPVVRGTLDMLVLKALSWKPMHALEIIAWLEDRSGGRFGVDDSALLQAFHRMEEKGLVAASWAMTPKNRRARYYRMTPKGRTHLKKEMDKLAEYNEMLSAILGAESP